MLIFKKPADIYFFLFSKGKEGITTGFVPTMGALHSGHIALVSKARSESQLVVCSIFINPTQFTDLKDFEKYPTTIENDIYLLETAGCDVLFLPTVADIYPEGNGAVRNYELGFLENTLEGKFRPGHFQGVCQVVHRLLDIVKPGRLYIGQKDFQQCMVLKKLVELIGCETQIIICTTLREQDGLAMSSRNLRLTTTERATAPFIYKALLSIKENSKASNFGQLKEQAIQLLTTEGFKVDYVEIANATTLEPIQNRDDKISIVILAAAYLNEVRLIDNIVLESN